MELTKIKIFAAVTVFFLLALIGCSDNNLKIPLVEELDETTPNFIDSPNDEPDLLIEETPNYDEHKVSVENIITKENEQEQKNSINYRLIHVFQPVQKIEEISDEQLIASAKDLLIGINLVSKFCKFDVSDFLNPDFDIKIGIDVDWEYWNQLQPSADSREDARKIAENDFCKNHRQDYTLEFIGESDYCYSFRIIFEQGLAWDAVDENGKFSISGIDYFTHAYRYFIYKNSALEYAYNTPFLKSQMLNEKSIRDILDLRTYFYVSEYWKYGRHQQLSRVVYRDVQEADDYGFIYTYYFVTIELNEQKEQYAQLGVHQTFIDGKTGQTSVLLNEIRKSAYMEI